MKKTLLNFIQTRTGFFTLLVVLFWIKYIFALYVDFNLGLSDPYQHIIMWTSPIGTAILLIGIGFLLSSSTSIIHCNVGNGLFKYGPFICKYFILSAIF